MTDDIDFTPKPGDMVLDRDDDEADPAVVANVPGIPAEDWTIPWLETTIAEDNPDYPADAPIALVVYVTHLEENEEALPEWDCENAVAISELNESSLSYYVFPHPRLEPAQTEKESGDESSESASEADTDLSAAVVALSRYLDGDGMDAEIADDGQSVRVTNAEHSYRVSLDSGVKGDGPHRSQLEEAVEKVRAATAATNE